MSIRISGVHSERIRGFDMTPMIDVVLQLIIFFMFTSQFGQFSRTPVDLPKEAGEQEVDPEPPTLAIDIASDGSLSLEAKPITFPGLVTVVQREIDRMGGDASKVDVLIRPDRAARAEHLNRIAQRFSGMGVRNWRIGTQPGG